jgi:RNA polymerase sigma-70 factor (ECF subfamily)
MQVEEEGSMQRSATLETESTRAHTTPLREDSPPTDEQLLGVVAADPSALGLLYDRHSKRVFGLALAILGSREEAEDLTHDVFVTLCTPTAYDPNRGSVGAFLTILTRSRAIDRLRYRGRSARLLETWHQSTLSVPVQTLPSEQVSMRRATERVRVALAELPAALRQVVEMAYYAGLSQREIAAELDTPLGTVKVRSRRALLALGHVLGDVAI